MELQKQAIARFGCTWLRPLGYARTLQQRWDEDAERQEAEETAAREANAAEMVRAQEREAEALLLQQGFLEGMAEMAADAEGAEGGRDLDADVPEGMLGEDDDEGREEISMEDGLEEEEDGGGESEVLEMDLENSMARVEAADSPTRHRFLNQDVMGLDGARDLDDDIPEGSALEMTMLESDIEDDATAAPGAEAEPAEEEDPEEASTQPLEQSFSQTRIQTPPPPQVTGPTPRRRHLRIQQQMLQDQEARRSAAQEARITQLRTLAEAAGTGTGANTAARTRRIPVRTAAGSQQQQHRQQQQQQQDRNGTAGIIAPAAAAAVAAPFGNARPNRDSRPAASRPHRRPL